ncbi:non-ribosomal peptide synthetase module [Paenibacillus pinisoli]|uniref:Non-ribosomal peptide synthetase module n=1 Tax=Paenibacillus pinisoli TaxID=1276110 RepID=A0A3A6PPW7_9BACL|nr:non-ribosomal peptide synthetase module [Paenibacillus pinisoli]RJX41438.1 non-ribosomal peptide synthetase module [Paenibacillus pinisoli]
MAKRLATEYVNAKLQLNQEEMTRFIAFMEDQQLRMQVLVLDNGNQELLLHDIAGREQVRLTFERRQDYYVCELSCRLVEPKLTNALRKAVTAFRGNAIVNRIYSHYTMIYHYRNGAVQKIVESSEAGERVVFEHKDTLGQLERVFRSRLIEREIGLIQGAVNELLDLRNQTVDRAEIATIDQRLTELTHKLFVLEA